MSGLDLSFLSINSLYTNYYCPIKKQNYITIDCIFSIVHKSDYKNIFVDLNNYYYPIYILI